MDFDKVIKERRSVRKFHQKKPNWRDIVEAIEAGINGPIAGDIANIRFILVDNPETISFLSKATQQDFIAETSYVVVVCSDPKDVLRFYDERGDIYVRQQAGAAIENFLLKITELGLGTCWVGSFVEDQVRFALKIPESVYVEAIFPIGYPFDKPSRRRKPSLDLCLYFNKYKQKVMKPKKEVEAK